uniref:Uncharacterized protein n=1 Tax=Arundo donax TaxID=35708 RepID=A0A0A9GJL2_ARUDO
MTQRRRVL